VAEYQGIYTDSSGDDPATIRVDGTTIGFTVRGVEFIGKLDCYRTALPSDSPARSSFTFVTNRIASDGGEMGCEELLAEFTLSWQMPMTVVAKGRIYPGELRVRYHLLDPGGPRAGEGGDTMDARFANLIDLALFYSYQKYTVTSGGRFKDILRYLMAMLGPDVSITGCIACAYSDFPLAGNGMYGDMFCFRNLKGAYRLLQQKPEPDRSGYLELSRDERVLGTGELYCCPEFEPRVPRTG
jgi:hypothetical protein